MNFHVLTLFPDMIEAGLHTSVTGRALQNGYIHLNAVIIPKININMWMIILMVEEREW